MTKENKKYYTTSDIATLLKISRRTAERQIKKFPTAHQCPCNQQSWLISTKDAHMLSRLKAMKNDP